MTDPLSRERLEAWAVDLLSRGPGAHRLDGRVGVDEVRIEFLAERSDRVEVDFRYRGESRGRVELAVSPTLSAGRRPVAGVALRGGAPDTLPAPAGEWARGGVPPEGGLTWDRRRRLLLGGVTLLEIVRRLHPDERRAMLALHLQRLQDEGQVDAVERGLLERFLGEFLLEDPGVGGAGA